jgi:O-antigen/teichoic acid export membrane protein
MTEEDNRMKDVESSGLSPDLDRLVLRGVGWLTVSLGGSQVLGLVSILVLARLLDPTDFGLVAIAATVVGVLQEFQESGAASALIYRRDDIERAAASVLVFAPVNAILLYSVGFFAAPQIASALGNKTATGVVRGLLVLVLIRSLAVVPAAILERAMDYRARMKIDVVTAVAQGVTAVGLALAGVGVWSLVAGQLAGGAAGLVVSWLLVPWRPSPRQASFRTLRQLLRYGRWVGGSRAVNIVNRTLDNVIVARLLGARSLGIYAIAFRLADLPVSLVGMILGRVMFPLYSQLQDDVDAVRRAFVQNLQRVALVLLPITLGLLIGARPIVLALLGSKWEAAVTPLRILAVWALVRSFVSPSSSVFDGRGKPHLSLWFLVPGTAILLGLLALLVPRWGINGAAAAQAIAISAVGIPSLLLAMRMIGLTVRVLARALAPSVLCSAILGVSLVLVTSSTHSLSPAFALVVLVLVGLVVYLSSTAIFARSVVMPIWWSMRGTSNQPLS